MRSDRARLTRGVRSYVDAIDFIGAESETNGAARLGHLRRPDPGLAEVGVLVAGVLGILACAMTAATGAARPDCDTFDLTCKASRAADNVFASIVRQVANGSAELIVPPRPGGPARTALTRATPRSWPHSTPPVRWWC
jgi:hypothetical protein